MHFTSNNMASSTPSRTSEDVHEEKESSIIDVPDSSALTQVPTKVYPPWSRIIPILFALYVSLFLVALVSSS
jgi:hypothetical protein